MHGKLRESIYYPGWDLDLVMVVGLESVVACLLHLISNLQC